MNRRRAIRVHGRQQIDGSRCRSLSSSIYAILRNLGCFAKWSALFYMRPFSSSVDFFSAHGRHRCISELDIVQGRAESRAPLNTSGVVSKSTMVEKP
jgi:hypothetical protein